MVKMSDIAKSLGVSIGTVDRALHNRSRIDPTTKQRVLDAAKAMGYQANLAASVLASKRRLRISINLPIETKDFYDDVRAGIQAEYHTYAKFTMALEFRSFPRLGDGEIEAFDDAIRSGVDGIISVFSQPLKMRSRVQEAIRDGITVVAVITGVPVSEHLASISIDPEMSGALAAGLMGQILRKQTGTIAIETGDLHAWEHKNKIISFTKTMRRFSPKLTVLHAMETHERQLEARKKTEALLDRHTDLVGYYVSTVNSMPVIQALESRKLLGKIALISTDVVPQIIDYLRSGAISATLDQRPRVQGELALRVLHKILHEGISSSQRIMLQPHVVMRANLEYFLRQARERDRVQEMADS